MGKKNSLSSTLKKKIPLAQKEVDTTDVKQTVDQLHQETTKEESKEKTSRLSIDTPKSLYTDIKVHCIKNGISIKEYMVGLALADLEKNNALDTYKSKNT